MGYFDELVFSTSASKQKQNIQNVTKKLNQDIIVTDLISFEDKLFIPTNLPHLSLSNLQYSDKMNMSRPHISNSAILDDDDDDDNEQNNPFKEDIPDWTVIPNKSDLCENIFGTVSNFDANSNVLYSISSIHTIYRDFLICNAEENDMMNDMSIYNQCTIFVWAFTTHISVDFNVENQAQNSKNAIKERTWHLKTKWFDKTVNHMCKQLTALTYCHSIKTLVVGGSSGYIALFDCFGSCYNIFCAHTDTITKMIWLNDSKQLVSTGLDGTIKIWKLYHSQFDNQHKNNNNNNVNNILPANKESIDEIIEPKIKKETIANRYIYREEPHAQEIEHRFDDNADLKIEDDDKDLDELYQSIDYDPFGNEAFDEYMDKRSKSMQAQSSTFYKPQKAQKTMISSKDLFAAQTVLMSEDKSAKIVKSESPQPSTFKVSKSGFKAMKIKNSSPKTQSSSYNDFDASMVDIESYIAQQHEVSSSNNARMEVPLPSDNSPDPVTTPIDFIENDSSPEPQRNSSFHVVKKTKPKRKKRKNKNKKKKRTSKNKKEKIMEMEPEDCTIRYENDQTVTDKITKKIASMRTKQKTNPFDLVIDDETNPFSADCTNPFAENAESVKTMKKKTNSTNPFMSDLP